ncbi:MAG: putative peptidoglycan lipid flippase [Moorella sp. (in: firmicutes)]|uniref:murein biosynthesis integral membrane protein MurJ n=1 Tax=Moorella sp. E306M TaxID=2572683 RepID=UPI0010FFB81F|nr:murein biosynthesis integral membrane protein MurJ [Moorella sp. E306M]MDK2815549.1 putative peptidoglycan lipid flippase [Moorella sp. (in: firmicutes)]MDK2894426.1 putative peptidoglycan lipid flippase [Moorella sp. (in: firmicutes)]GEA16910.1 putative lipid II flippase MurJ [Moorella sp. E306M]
MVKQGTMGLARSVAIMSLAAGVSRILGFLRNTAISALFGQNQLTDMLNTSFVIPDTIYLILVGGGVSSAFIPVLASYLAEENEDAVWQTVSIAFNLVLTLVGVAVTLGMIWTPWLIHLIAPGFDADQVAYTAYLTRIVLVAILFHCLNGVLMGTEYAYQSFIGTAIGPLVYNAAIIVFGLALAEKYSIAAFAISTLIGAALNFLVQVWGVWHLKPRYRLVLDLKHPGIRRIFKLMLPVTIGLSIAQLNLFFNQTFIASYLPRGSINALTISSRVVLVPILFASSMGIALLPALTRIAMEGDFRSFTRYLSGSLRAVVFISIPATVGLIALGQPVVRVLFQHGRFTSADTLATTEALVFYSLGITAYGAYEILSRAFYATQDTVTPLKIGLVTLAAGTALNFTLGPAFGIRGLALAYSLAGCVNVALLLYYLRRKVEAPLEGRRLLQTALKSLLAALVMGLLLTLAAAHILLPVTWPRLVREGLELALLITLGVLSYAGLAWLLRMEELAMFLSLLGRRLRRSQAAMG